MEKGKVCVTGGTGYVASWLIFRLLQQGYSVNTTIRPQLSGVKKDLGFLTGLPGAGDRLHIFSAEFENPQSFEPAIEGCVGVFHVAHPVYFHERESEETMTDKCVEATLAILTACLNSKTVKRVVYTSSVSAVMFKEEAPDVLDEDVWTDVDFVRNSKLDSGHYRISKTVTERAALEFADRHGLDVVTVILGWVHGPFICPNLPGSVCSCLALFLGNENQFKFLEINPMVHTDDVASAHIFLFEHRGARGRYICSAAEIKYDDLREFLRRRYPQMEMSSPQGLMDPGVKIRSFSSKKLLEAGFRYKYGLEEIYDDAIECCKKKGFL